MDLNRLHILILRATEGVIDELYNQIIIWHRNWIPATILNYLCKTAGGLYLRDEMVRGGVFKRVEVPDFPELIYEVNYHYLIQCLDRYALFDGSRRRVSIDWWRYSFPPNMTQNIVSWWSTDTPYLTNMHARYSYLEIHQETPSSEDSHLHAVQSVFTAIQQAERLGLGALIPLHGCVVIRKGKVTTNYAALHEEHLAEQPTDGSNEFRQLLGQVHGFGRRQLTPIMLDRLLAWCLKSHFETEQAIKGPLSTQASVEFWMNIIQRSSSTSGHYRTMARKRGFVTFTGAGRHSRSWSVTLEGIAFYRHVLKLGTKPKTKSFAA